MCSKNKFLDLCYFSTCYRKCSKYVLCIQKQKISMASLKNSTDCSICAFSSIFDCATCLTLRPFLLPLLLRISREKISKEQGGRDIHKHIDGELASRKCKCISENVTNHELTSANRNQNFGSLDKSKHEDQLLWLCQLVEPKMLFFYYFSTMTFRTGATAYS